LFLSKERQPYELLPALSGETENMALEPAMDRGFDKSRPSRFSLGESVFPAVLAISDGKAVEAFSDARLQHTVPGRDYDFYHLYHGIVQHSLYHGGQIALLKKSHERNVSG
jgi:hypothetical protein